MSVRFTVSDSIANRTLDYLSKKHPEQMRIGITMNEAIEQMLRDLGF